MIGNTQKSLQSPIERYSKKRGIECLVHFTRVENLNRILRDGIVPRETLENNNESFLFNDIERLDRHLDASCLSITFPNYRMFYRLRQEAGTSDKDWVVIGIDPAVLWEKDCAFCFTNAATNEISKSNIETLKDVEAFKDMFYDSDGLRDILDVDKNETTDPQAEILVFDVIEPEYFIGVACYTRNVRDSLIEEYGSEFNFIKEQSLFSYRHDYAFWKKTEE